MAILIDSPKGQGYIACRNGQPRTHNPHYGITPEILCYWYEWIEGWKQAYDEGKFGVDNERKN